MKSTLSPPHNKETESWTYTEEAGFFLVKRPFSKSVGDLQTQQEDQKIIAAVSTVSPGKMIGTLTRQQSIDGEKSQCYIKPLRKTSNSKQLHISNKMIQDLRQHASSNKGMF